MEFSPNVEAPRCGQVLLLPNVPAALGRSCEYWAATQRGAGRQQPLLGTPSRAIRVSPGCFYQNLSISSLNVILRFEQRKANEFDRLALTSVCRRDKDASPSTARQLRSPRPSGWTPQRCRYPRCGRICFRVPCASLCNRYGASIVVVSLLFPARQFQADTKRG